VYPEYTTDKLPDRLLEHLRANPGARTFRRRAILVKANGRWHMLCCTVEGLFGAAEGSIPTPSRRYRDILLFEDLATGGDCVAFANGVNEGRAQFGELVLRDGQNRQWTSEHVSVQNVYMGHAGHVISLRFCQTNAIAPGIVALAPGEPYYPDVYEAARDWLPFPVYHGNSDARNGHVVFLLPESRAFIEGVNFTEKGELDIAVGGTEISSLSLQIKGAYWEGKLIRHFDAVVHDSRASVVVPRDAKRVEYYLIDAAGNAYDFRQWNGAVHTGGDGLEGDVRHRLEKQVRAACASGEGERIEFKPFIELSEKHSRTGNAAVPGKQRTKLREVIETVAAFANTEGGCVFLGVENDCTISGIDHRLRSWANADATEGVVQKYLGELRSRVKDAMHGEVAITLSHVTLAEGLVAIMGVAPSEGDPLALKNEYHLYVRTGPNNRKASPDQWKIVLQRTNKATSFTQW
jgi:hypothetical protein